MKNWSALALVLALCLLTNGQQSISAQASPKLRPLRIALPSHSVSSSPIYLAKSLGIFERYGFETQILVLEPRAALAALLTGDLDFYTAAGTTGRAALRGVPVRVVMVAMNRSDQVVVAAKEFTSVEQLRGKTLGGYTAQASANIVLIEMLRRQGLKPEDYKILNIGTNRASALLSGQIPAAVLTAVEAARLTRQGFRVLARASDDIELSSGGVGHCHRQFAEQARRHALGGSGRIGRTPDRCDAKRAGCAGVYEAIRPERGRSGISLRPCCRLVVGRRQTVGQCQ